MTQRFFSAQSAAETLDSVCTVYLGGEIFSVRLTDVVEVVTAVHVQDCPLSPAYIAGLMHYRGDVLTVVHLRALLGLSASTQAEHRHITMVMAGVHGLFAMQVDGMGEVRSLETSLLESMPALMDAERHSFLHGMYKLDQGLLPLLDVQRLEPIALRAWTAAHMHEAKIAGREESPRAIAS